MTDDPHPKKLIQINSEDDIQRFAEFLRELLKIGKRPLATVDYHKKVRTPKQNNALHKFLRTLAFELNQAGLDMRKVLKPEVEIPWNERTAKRELWVPLQVAYFDEEHTSKLSTSGYNTIYNILARHMGEKHGFTVPPWPCEDSLMEESLRHG